MKPSKVAAQWLLDHNHSLEELDSLVELINSVRYHQGWVGEEPEYDTNFGDARTCLCGHPYYRHFDTYDGMSPVGCKYCYHGEGYGNHFCDGFKEAPTIIIRADAEQVQE